MKKSIRFIKFIRSVKSMNSREVLYLRLPKYPNHLIDNRKS